MRSLILVFATFYIVACAKASNVTAPNYERTNITQDSNIAAKQMDKDLVPVFKYHFSEAEENYLQPSQKTKWNTFRDITLGERMPNYKNLRQSYDGFEHKYGAPEPLGDVKISNIHYYARMGVVTRLKFRFESELDSDKLKSILTNRFGVPHSISTIVGGKELQWSVNESGMREVEEGKIRYQITLSHGISSNTYSYKVYRYMELDWKDIKAVQFENNKFRERFKNERQRDINKAVQDSVDDF